MARARLPERGQPSGALRRPAAQARLRAGRYAPHNAGCNFLPTSEYAVFLLLLGKGTANYRDKPQIAETMHNTRPKMQETQPKDGSQTG